MDRRDLEVRRAREAALAGGRPVAGATPPRREVAASWRRMAICGLDPSGPPPVPPLPGTAVEQRRAASPLAPVLASVERSLLPVVDVGQLVVVTDDEGRVLWQWGSPGVRRMAEDLGFVAGSAWTEGNVGTNAVGTALVLGTPVQIRGGEHFVESHTRWGCVAAPVLDPWSGRTLGVVDVSGPSRSLHPAELALVELASRLATHELREERRGRLDRLRAHAAPVLARVGGPALVVDRDGHLAAATQVGAPDLVPLPGAMTEGPVRLPRLGTVQVEALAGGWLLRLGGREETTPARLVLDLAGEPEVRLSGDAGGWGRRLSRRHAEILLALLSAGPDGLTAAALARDLFDEPGQLVSVRAEMSRLRRGLGEVVLTRPYRLDPRLDCSLRLPADPRALLPGSSAPVVLRTRAAAAADGGPGGGAT